MRKSGAFFLLMVLLRGLNGKQKTGQPCAGRSVLCAVDAAGRLAADGPPLGSGL